MIFFIGFKIFQKVRYKKNYNKWVERAYDKYDGDDK